MGIRLIFKLMNSFYLKFLVIALLFVGEALSIYAEMFGAHSHDLNSQPVFTDIFKDVFYHYSCGRIFDFGLYAGL